MHVHYHIILGFLFSLLLSPIVGYFSLIIFLSSFLIDIDHYFYYVVKKRDFNLINSVNYFLEKHRVKAILFFHSVEFLALLIILSFVNYIFIYISLGIGFHFILDIYSSLYLNIYRPFSLFFYHKI